MGAFYAIEPGNGSVLLYSSRGLHKAEVQIYCLHVWFSPHSLTFKVLNVVIIYFTHV